MKMFLTLLVASLAIGQSLAVGPIECYQCNPVTKECDIGEAAVVKCGNNAVCDTHVKEGSPDQTKALRRCAIPNAQGMTSCTPGYSCHVCNTNLCNKPPEPTATQPSATEQPSAATAAKFAWVGWVVVGAMLYMD
ncbi:hypothetical protein BDFB_008781 [Asbolus verrucosus]|uniref:Uncharacterized protein n=1 Tax=Asbolus verrucosus TaxID=1661398 RepID=A0A482WBZ3_ASBVE|nr:hypothetical protein BDFB_008781 [Asbolus verrucosus]